ncbi:MAG: phytanoyl-CoA dioxygenase family protein [Proteobacteria bacterium]|nr:phytanoyl-CoA dioxygenase family protein [Pseudomonadota bacterium]
MVRNTAPNPYATLDASDWWHPEKLKSDAERGPGEGILSEAEVSQFRHAGFVVVNGLWPEELVAQASSEARELHPPARILEAVQAGTRFRGFSAMPWTGWGEASADAALNQMTIHPRALGAVAQLMGVNMMDLRLSQSHVIAKVGRMIDRPGHQSHGTIEGDQDIHVDYGNNTLMVPARTAPPDCVACLCYYSDVGESGGATHFVKAEEGELTSYEPADFNPPNFVAGTENGSAAVDTGPRSPERVAQRYREEKPIHYQPGTCVLYGMNTWHRGTPVALGKVRHTHHHVWRRRDAEWVNWQSLAPSMAAMPPRYLASLSVPQRTVLGFAAPGDRYWTPETLDAVSQRYVGMDMTPYRDAATEGRP